MSDLEVCGGTSLFVPATTPSRSWLGIGRLRFRFAVLYRGNVNTNPRNAAAKPPISIQARRFPMFIV